MANPASVGPKGQGRIGRAQFPQKADGIDPPKLQVQDEAPAPAAGKPGQGYLAHDLVRFLDQVAKKPVEGASGRRAEKLNASLGPVLDEGVPESPAAEGAMIDRKHPRGALGRTA